MTTLVITAGQWVDVYATSGISRETKLKIQNTSSTRVWVSDKVTQPSLNEYGEVVMGTNDFSEVYQSSLWVRADEYAATIVVVKDEAAPPAVQAISIQDYAGKQGTATVFGETVVGERTDQVNIQFQYNISTIDTKTTLTGTGTTGHTQGVASIYTGTGVGSARLESKASVRYITGHECVCHFTEDFAPPQANTVQQHGLFDASNGAMVGYQGTQFGVFVRKGGVDTFIPQSSFNGDKVDGSGKSGHTLNPQAYNIYFISYGWLGIAPITFSIYGGHDKGWILLHSFDIVNTGEGPHMLDPTLPVAMYIARTSGSGSNMQMKTSSWRAGIIGKTPVGSLTDRGWVRFVEQKSIPSNTLTPVLTLRNKATYGGFTNHVRVRYATVSLSVDGTKSVTWQVLSNPTLTGAVYVDQDTTNSVSEYDVTATAVTGGKLIGGVVMGKTDTTRINLFDGDVIIAVYPNETVTLAARSTGATTVDVFLRWVEEF